MVTKERPPNRESVGGTPRHNETRPRYSTERDTRLIEVNEQLYVVWLSGEVRRLGDIPFTGDVLRVHKVRPFTSVTLASSLVAGGSDVKTAFRSMVRILKLSSKGEPLDCDFEIAGILGTIYGGATSRTVSSEITLGFNSPSFSKRSAPPQRGSLAHTYPQCRYSSGSRKKRYSLASATVLRPFAQRQPETFSALTGWKEPEELLLGDTIRMYDVFVEKHLV